MHLLFLFLIIILFIKSRIVRWAGHMVTWEWGGDEICVQGYGGPPPPKKKNRRRRLSHLEDLGVHRKTILTF